MAKLFRTPKTRIDEKTGKRIIETDGNGDIVFTPYWHARIEDHMGRRRNFTLSENRAQAQREADMIENREREIRLGLRPPPSPAEQAATRLAAEILEEYFAWGAIQGGRKGRPWSKSHSRNKHTILRWWLDALGAKYLSDFAGCLSLVEKELQKVASEGRASRTGKRRESLTGKTLQSFAGELGAFFSWCVTRKYLTENPLDGISRFNTTPQTVRRALTVDELRSLLDAAPLYLRMLVEVAICTGLRLGELGSLTVGHFNHADRTIRVDAEHDKGRVLRYQPLPKRLVEPLKEFTASGLAVDMYRKHYGRRDAKRGIPDTPLLFVPTHAARSLRRVADKAGVPWTTELGKMDFHTLRVAYINLIIGTGADVKTTQTLARHSTPTMTMNGYGRAVDERIAKAVEALGDLVLPSEEEPPAYSLALLA